MSRSTKHKTPLYAFFRVIVRLLLWIYYPKTSVINKERLKITRPTILACSHPNTMMDPLHAAARVNVDVYFLANAGLFVTRFWNWFYSNFYCIPIKRISDQKTETRKKVSNRASFERVISFLANGGCLWIAPEGGSYWGRHWLSLKTGAARMALLAEAEKDFEAGLQILPIGLNYAAPDLFRTRLVINVGEPINVSDYKADYEAEYYGAVKKLTTELEHRLQELEISPSDEEEDDALGQLEQIIQRELPASTKADFYRSKNLLKQIQQNKNAELHEEVDDYFMLLKKEKITDRAVQRYYGVSSFMKFLDRLWVLLGFPLFLYGFANNMLPSLLPEFIARRKTKYIGYRATVRMATGFLIFPFFYVLQTVAVHYFIGIWWVSLLYFLTLIPAGLFAWHYVKWVRFVLKGIRLKRRSQEVIDALVQQRKAIVKRLLDFVG